MARDRRPVGGVILLPLFVLLCTGLGATSVDGSDILEQGRLVLPLEFTQWSSLSSPLVDTRLLDHHRRRHLQTEAAEDLTHPNAHMSLFDDLLTNGYYTTRVFIGTPPQKFALIVDSGSTVTYVPCSSCEQCGNHEDPKFQPNQSSTYKPLQCNGKCRCDHEKNQCTYERQYAEMSSSSGVLGEDVLSFGQLSELKPQRAVFGCENAETGDLFSQRADGIIGLGRGPLSIMDQLVDKGVISNSFSLCYGGMDIGGGAMVLGGITKPQNMVFSHSNPDRSQYYNIELKELHVDGNALPLDAKIFDSNHGTILDSGTTYAYLPEQAFVAFRNAVSSKLQSLKQIPGPDPNYKDVCFSGAGRDVSQLSKIFPSVDLVFGEGQKLSLSPENYLFRHAKVDDGYCLGIFQNGRDKSTLLGGIIVRNTLVTYDRQNKTIGFWKTNCSELWERLHDNKPPSPGSSTSNSSDDNSSALPPAGMTSQVGLIKFDMLINVTYSDLAPHLDELASFIAQKLQIDRYRVHLMKVERKGNFTVISWAISPSGSDKFMSNSTAMDIIAHLKENRVLPDSFGTYELLEWDVEPPSNRSWLQQHVAFVAVGIVAISIFGLSAFVAWRIFKRIRSTVMYKPVDEAVPEQEMQRI